MSADLQEAILGAFALMLVIEGLLPFLSPGKWREALSRAMQLSDGQIRFVALSAMLTGLAILLFFWR